MAAMDDFGLDGGLGIPAPEAPDQAWCVRRIGYRWIASRGKDACPQCAALHGKVFYFEPGSGQASVDEMPQGQLHPNCRCTREPVSEVKIPGVSNPKPKPYMLGKVEGRGGFFFRLLGLNSKSTIPIYGRYGGPYWTGGRDTSNDTQPDPHVYDAPGDDDLDEACKSHDLCYDAHGRDCLECDRKLYEDLNALDSDPQYWASPPATQDDVDYAKRYRNMAIGLFWMKIKAAEIENAIKGNAGKNMATLYQL
jgi:hypothetical protein